MRAEVKTTGTCRGNAASSLVVARSARAERFSAVRVERSAQRGAQRSAAPRAARSAAQRITQRVAQLRARGPA